MVQSERPESDVQINGKVEFHSVPELVFQLVRKG